MTTQKYMEIAEWTGKSELLLEKTKDLFQEINYDNIQIPTSVYDHEKPISLVFVGQFSAGKSTIIKALTGIDDIETGKGQVTNNVEKYIWRDIQVIDRQFVSHYKRQPSKRVDVESITIRRYRSK